MGLRSMGLINANSLFALLPVALPSGAPADAVLAVKKEKVLTEQELLSLQAPQYVVLAPAPPFSEGGSPEYTQKVCLLKAC